MPSDSVPPVGSSGLGPGTILDGKYEILTRIGAGGMGEVFKARHLHLNAFRCIKVMKQGLLADEVYRMRFLREARLATQVHHPNIAVVHDFFVGEGGNYMVTEFIDGNTLRQWSAAHGPFPIALAADVASQVLAGLEHIHRRGLLHRDISPDNVMLSYDSDDRLETKIIDLGIAKDVNTASADKTMAGVLIGNPKYMSPEQLGLIGEDEELDGRTDLYSLGVVLYEMLLGVSPFASETPQGYIMKHLTQPPARFADVRPDVDVPMEIEHVIFRVLEKDRGRRYRDARALADALEPFLDARVGALTRIDVSRLRRGPEKTLSQPLPVSTIGPNDATVAEISSTEVKARAFEESLLDDVRAREREGDRGALQRLGEAHPRGSRVGDAAREALARVTEALKREREEEEAFQRAWEDGRATAWREFLDEHADSARGARAGPSRRSTGLRKHSVLRFRDRGPPVPQRLARRAASSRSGDPSRRDAPARGRGARRSRGGAGLRRGAHQRTRGAAGFPAPLPERPIHRGCEARAEGVRGRGRAGGFQRGVGERHDRGVGSLPRRACGVAAHRRSAPLPSGSGRLRAGRGDGQAGDVARVPQDVAGGTPPPRRRAACAPLISQSDFADRSAYGGTGAESVARIPEDAIKITIDERGLGLRDRLRERLERAASLRCDEHGQSVLAVKIADRENGWFDSLWTTCCEPLTNRAAAIVKERC
jgi:serine/threonine protein kinase